MTHLEYIACPLCGENEFTPVYEGITEAEKNIHHSAESYYPTAAKGKLVNQVVSCRVCGFVYTNPREDRQDILKKYRNYVDPAYLSEEKSRRWNARRLIKYIEKFTAPPGRWLDMGCSAGFFVDEVQKSGWEAYGKEQSLWASNYARNTLGVNVANGCIEELQEYPDNYFDVVSMVLVLAHVIDPASVISEISRVLKNNGLLFIQTPDFNSLMSRIMGKNWKTIKWQMLYFFARTSLTKLLSKENLQIVAHRKRGLGKGYSLNYILTHLFEDKYKRSHAKILQKMHLAEMNIYLNLYEYLNVVVRKKHT